MCCVLSAALLFLGLEEQLCESNESVESDDRDSVINFNYIGIIDDNDIKNIAKNMGYNFVKYLVDVNPPSQETLMDMTGIILVDLRDVDVAAMSNYVSRLIDNSINNFIVISYWSNLNKVTPIFKNYTYPVNGYSSLMSTISKASAKYKDLS